MLPGKANKMPEDYSSLKEYSKIVSKKNPIVIRKIKGCPYNHQKLLINGVIYCGADQKIKCHQKTRSLEIKINEKVLNVCLQS
jgi:hypothetical protein